MFPPAFLLFFLFVFFPAVLKAESPNSDPQAVALLRQTLAVSGASLNPIHTFLASGTIAYFWAGDRVEGPATIRVRGWDEVRLDADLPDGRRSLAAGRDGGRRKTADGKFEEIPAHNRLSAGPMLTVSYPAIAAALAEPTATIVYAGLPEPGGAEYRIRSTREFSKESDPDGILSKLSRTDYVIDARTGLVIRVEDVTHPVENLSEEYSRVVEMEQYAVFHGVAVPTLVREKVAGQTVWEFRLSSITFNANLPDTDFLLQ
jgi:hypothetical protein